MSGDPSSFLPARVADISDRDSSQERTATVLRINARLIREEMNYSALSWTMLWSLCCLARGIGMQMADLSIAAKGLN